MFNDFVSSEGFMFDNCVKSEWTIWNNKFDLNNKSDTFISWSNVWQLILSLIFINEPAAVFISCSSHSVRQVKNYSKYTVNIKRSVPKQTGYW